MTISLDSPCVGWIRHIHSLTHRPFIQLYSEWVSFQDRNHDKAVLNDKAVLRTQNRTSSAPTATDLCLLEKVDVKKMLQVGEAITVTWGTKEDDTRLTGKPKVSSRSSLVAQQVRICLPFQRSQVRSLVWQESTCCRATKPEHHDYGSSSALRLSSGDS